MKKTIFILSPLVLASLLALILGHGLKHLLPDGFSYTVPVNFVHAQVLTAAQLNSVNNTAANAFNGHNHSGTDGEASTVAFTAISSSFTAAGDMTFNGASSSLECDGTTATDLLLDQGNFGVVIGDGALTSDVSSARQLLLNANTGDASIRMQVGNSSSTAWDMFVDNSDSDNLEWSFNGGASGLVLSTAGDLTIADDLLVGSASSGDSEVVQIRCGAGTACTLQLTEASSTTDWTLQTDGSGSDAGVFSSATSGSNTFKFQGASNGLVNIQMDGTIELTGNEGLIVGDNNIASGSTPTVNKLYPNTVPKAWANTASGASINDGVGLSVASGGTGVYNYTLARAMAGTNQYACTCTGLNSAARMCTVVNSSSSAFVVRVFDASGTLTSTAHSVICLGEQ